MVIFSVITYAICKIFKSLSNVISLLKTQKQNVKVHFAKKEKEMILTFLSPESSKNTPAFLLRYVRHTMYAIPLHHISAH